MLEVTPEPQAHAAAKGVPIDRALLELEFISEDDLASALGAHFDIPGFSLARLPKPDPKVSALVPEPIARKCAIVPLEKAGSTLILLMADPTDMSSSARRISRLTASNPAPKEFKWRFFTEKRHEILEFVRQRA